MPALRATSLIFKSDIEKGLQNSYWLSLPQ
jgi:hypothetical protein